MTRFLSFIGMFLALLVFAATPAHAEKVAVPERILGNADAPITVDEYVSLTCPHCAEFYNTVLPELEKRYVDTGKVRFIMRDFPLDGVSLKAAALARCMPEDEFYPFVKVLYKSQASWVVQGNAETILIQYAKLGGLSEDRAKACLNDKDMQDAIIAERTTATEKFGIDSTPTFIINNGAETMKGALGVDAYANVFDRLLAANKQK